MMLETRLMVSYFTGGAEVVSGDNDFSKIPHHLEVAPWFSGDIGSATLALEDAVSEFEDAIKIATGVFIPSGKGRWEMSVSPYKHLELDRLNSKVLGALAKFAMYPENPNYSFRPVIFKDIDQPKLPPFTDLEVDHLALVEDHQTGTFSIPEVVLIGQV
jgi:hypothetical protein